MNLDIKPRKHEKLGQLLGRSSAMRQVFKQIKKAAAVDTLKKQKAINKKK